MADIGGGEPQQPGNEQGKGKEGEGAVGLSHDGLVFAMLEKFSGSLLWWEGYLKILFHLLNNFHRAVVVAVVAVLVVQTAVYDVVDVVAVFDRCMAAAFAVNVLVVGMGMAVAHFVSFHKGVFIDGVMIAETDVGCK